MFSGSAYVTRGVLEDWRRCDLSVGIKEPLPHLCLFSMSQDDRELSEALARSADSTARDARIAARVAAQARIAARVASQARAREPEPAGVVGLVGEASLSGSQSAPAVSPLSEETPAGVVGLVGYASLSGSQSAPSVSTISEEMPPLEGENISARALHDQPKISTIVLDFSVHMY